MRLQRAFEFSQKKLRRLSRHLPSELHSRNDSLLVIIRKARRYSAFGVFTMAFVGTITPSFRSYTLVYLENLYQMSVSIQLVLDGFLGLVIVVFTSYSIGVGVVGLLRYILNRTVRAIEDKHNSTDKQVIRA